MIDRRACLVVFVVLLLALICPVYAGAVFDDILNAMQIDQILQRNKRDNWGNITNVYKSITQDAPLGQTFIIGDSVERLCRIALNVSYSNEEWQPGETLVLTLWDSPDKKTKSGNFGIPYERRLWNQGIIMFTLEARVEPKKQYYYELTVEGGDGKIAGILAAKAEPYYTDGTAYEGNQPQKYDLWFETYVKKTADKNANLAGFYNSFNLDYPGLEKAKAAVNIKDWDIAEKEFLAYFESRKDLFPDDTATSVLDPKYDTKEADLVLQHKWLYDGTIVDFGSDWNFNSINEPHLVSIITKHLADAYVKTGDEKYARAWNEMLKSIYREYPSPLRSGLIKNDEKVRNNYPSGIYGSPNVWGLLAIPTRIYPNKYNKFRKSPSFEPDARMAWWLSIIESANLLERRDSNGSSWEGYHLKSLLSIGQLYPELKRHREWFSQGFEYIKNSCKGIQSDWVVRYYTMPYFTRELEYYLNVFESAREYGLEIPQDCLNVLEKSFEYVMYSTQPNWKSAICCDAKDLQELLSKCAKFFNRDDMRWVATQGKVGRMPSITSVGYPKSACYIMRSGWDSNANFLLTNNGSSTNQFNIIVSACGTDFLPNIKQYRSPGNYEYLSHTSAYNTVCVDGKDAGVGSDYSTWSTLPLYDYYDGRSSGYKDLKDVKHERTIFFMKPEYWVVADRINGLGEHDVDQYWHFPFIKIEHNAASGIARTLNSNGSNISLIPIHYNGIKSTLTETLNNIDHVSFQDAPIVTYRKSEQLPAAFCTVLFPSPANSKEKVKASELICDDSSLKTDVLGAQVSFCDNLDYIVSNKAARGISVNSSKLKLNAEAAVVRTRLSDSKVLSFFWQSGSSLSFGKTLLATSNMPVKALSVTYKNDTVTIDAEEPDASLQVATMGAKRAVVNGKAIQLQKGRAVFSPFK